MEEPRSTKGAKKKMHTTIKRNRLATFIGRIAAVTLLAAAGMPGLQAQQSAGTAPTLPPISLKSSLAAPLDLSAPSDLGYSSSTGSAEMANAESFTLSSADQPPPRRRYGRPNYNDSHTNSDGSAKYTFFVGGGFTLPTGGTHNYATPSWKIQVGGGRNFSKTLGVLVQFDYDKFGMQTSTLNKQLALYNQLCGGSCGFSLLGGNIHDWSFTLGPIYNFYTSDSIGAYAIGGVGFYHKYTQFTTPTTGTCFSSYYGYYTCSGNIPIDWYTSNAFGVNGGLGITYKFSRFANERFYAEARYVWTANQRKPFDVSGTTSYFNAFTQASARTTYIPITFGIRF
jgi:hypothetical protein